MESPVILVNVLWRVPVLVFGCGLGGNSETTLA
jgi:hypothetical protein